MTDQKKVREAFEAWAYEQAFDLTRFLNGELYNNPFTQDAWAGWQAALAHASSATAEECSVVEASGGEAVVWQIRHKKPRSGWTEWCEIPADVANSYIDEWGSLRGREYGLSAEVRKLYTSPRATAEDVRDAERYRWLRMRHRSMSPHMDGTMQYCMPMMELRGRSFDDAIDQAIAKGREVGNG